MDLYGLKEDSMALAKAAPAVLVGAAAARVVSKLAADMLAPVSKKDAAGAETLSAAEIEKNKQSVLRKLVAPALPVAVGLATQMYGKDRFPVAAPGVAAGMVAYGLGAIIVNYLPAPKDAKSFDLKAYMPFAGLGGDTYDTGLMGLGAYGAGVDAYMGLGYGGYSMEPGAPVAIETLRGAPTQVQSLMGSPTQVQSLMGLGSSIVGSSAPLSASLM